MGRIKNALQKANNMKGKINPQYTITGVQLMEIYEGSEGLYDALANAFDIGYLQGMKAAKAEMRKGGAVNG